MKRALPLALVALLAVLAVTPASAARASARYALAGEARGLEVAVGDQGVTLGMALAQVDSTPRAVGVGAGQCSLLGETADPDDLPCSDENTERTQYPGTGGDENPTCSGGLPAPLDALLDIDVACGSSKTWIARGVPQTQNSGNVAELKGNIPLESVLPVDANPDKVVDQLTAALDPVLDETPEQVREAVDEVVSLLGEIDATDVIAGKVGPATSDISAKGSALTASSTAAAARIGVLGVPSARNALAADPLNDGLVIIEVGPSSATATIDKADASARAAASAAIVKVKVRDVTKPEPTYVELEVAPGQSVTVLEGTPAESTITAAAATTRESKGSAQAAADAVRLHLLKGVQGGVKLGLSRSTAAARGAVTEKAAPPPAPSDPGTRPKVLPMTGARDVGLVALTLLALAATALVVRRRLS